MSRGGGSAGLSTKPKSRIHHLLAKIAGSDAAKAIKPKTKNECMLYQIKGLPIATESDAGKSVIVSESGEYALGGGSGGGGGANVLTLYMGMKDGKFWAYKNLERTEVYASFEEALDAVSSADVIKLDDSESDFADVNFARRWTASLDDDKSVYVYNYAGADIPLYAEGGR